MGTFTNSPRSKLQVRGKGHRLAPMNASRRAALSSTAAGLVGAGLLAGAGAAGAAALGLANSANPQSLISSGMQKFRQQDVDGACRDFDTVWDQAPRLRPFLWQRGLALYYQSRFVEGAEQFRSDVAVNPNDTEEAIWAFICEARIYGPEKARANFLQVGRDPRPVMRAVYETFKNGESPDKIKASSSRDGSGADFYSLLYAGLLQESLGTLDDPGAKRDILRACATPYAQLSDDYMAALARVHLRQRGWLEAE